MAKSNVITLDLMFQGQAQAIASYMLRDGDAVVLVESGPGSTRAALQDALAAEGLNPKDVTHVLLTHIHLDHAGASGWLAGLGAEIFVHPNGAPHLADPAKLIASATRIYGDRMEPLWGEILPVDRQRMNIPMDGDEISIGGLKFIPIDTPGHAGHHYCYIFEDICFSGDVGGVRIPGYAYLRAPMPPPELHIGHWRTSLSRLRAMKFSRIAPTHFGIYNNPDWHLDQLDSILVATEEWLEAGMHGNPSIDELRQSFILWMDEQARRQGLDQAVQRAFDLANPLGMSADGLMRYWNKVCKAAVTRRMSPPTGDA
jgi:glyoxylase-like metal-dependent hydrolase (beta-lactamase superfamily II)